MQTNVVRGTGAALLYVILSALTACGSSMGDGALGDDDAGSRGDVRIFTSASAIANPAKDAGDPSSVSANANSNASDEPPFVGFMCTSNATPYGAACECRLGDGVHVYQIECDRRTCVCATDGAPHDAVPDTIETSCYAAASGAWPGSMACGFPRD